MTCKECLWCDVCKSRVTQFGYDFDEDKEVPEFGCGVVVDGFKNKADFVEVVRCEKCKYRIIHTCAITGIETLFCDYGNIPVAVEPTHFCSYGKRRTNNDL